MIIPVVSACFYLVAAAVAFPSRFVSDSKQNTLHKNLEIVGGPREFFVPIPQMASPQDSPTDLDYMVYGKLYLMRAMKVADRSGFGTENTENIQMPNPSHIQSSPKGNYGDSIAFPTNSRGVKRPYQYKWSNINKLRQISEDETNRQQSENSGYRKLEERSADQESGINKVTTASIGIPDATTEAPSTIDEEALELIQKLMPKSLIQTDQASITKDGRNDNDGETQGNNNSDDLNLTTDNFEIDNRFLINVPMKPNFTQCPEGQKRTHRGTCKPFFVHIPSPNDGIFQGMLLAAASNVQRNDPISPSRVNGRKDDIHNLQLTALFRSVVQLERRLERTIKEAEKQLGEMVQERSNTSSTTKVSNDAAN